MTPLEQARQDFEDEVQAIRCKCDHILGHLHFSDSRRNAFFTTCEECEDDIDLDLRLFACPINAVTVISCRFRFFANLSRDVTVELREFNRVLTASECEDWYRLPLTDLHRLVSCFERKRWSDLISMEKEDQALRERRHAYRQALRTKGPMTMSYSDSQMATP